MDIKTHLDAVNPKAININELYDTFDPLTRK